MSRRHAAVKKVIKPDTKYNSLLLSRFINNIMKDGKKALAEKIVYGALDRVEKKHSSDLFNSGRLVMNVINDFEEIKIKDIKLQFFPQIHGPIQSLGIRVDGFVYSCDVREFPAVAIKKREDTHKMAESNKAFAHFAQRTSQR